MRRHKQHLFQDNQHAERWLISYADFITLLFAFFVVMYSISQVNESKYKILSSALVKAFDTPPSSLQPIQIGEPNLNNQIVADADPAEADLESGESESGNTDENSFASSEEFKDLENSLKGALGSLIAQDLAELKSDANWINITLRSGLLFPSGSDALNSGADPLLEEVSKHINTNNQLLIIHGHTDNIPIQTERFPSNWELSSARAVAVVRKLQNLDVYAPRMSVEGHGEYQPIAPNDTARNRAKNRRVVISISRKQQVTDRLAEFAAASAQQKEDEQQFEITRLPDGGLLIRGKEPAENQNNNP